MTRYEREKIRFATLNISSQRTSAMSAIMFLIEARHNVSEADIRGKSRKAHIVAARHEFAHTAHKLNSIPADVVGKYLDHCDHTSVLAACKKFEKVD